METLEEAAAAIDSLKEGIFLPIHADSGTGKTTLAENLNVFLPQVFTPTLTYSGAVLDSEMTAAVKTFEKTLAANDSRVIPMNVDHREGRPATSEEVSEIKRFLRLSGGKRVLLVWPETVEQLSRSMSEAYRTVAGVVPLNIPIAVDGPDRETWGSLAAQTLELVNEVDSLEQLVDLDAYDVHAFHSIGDYLRKVALDFNAQKLALARSTKRPVDVTILFVSETSGHGILASLTSSKRFGQLDPSALLQACPSSDIGEWWAAHRGLLIQTIVTLDAHAFSVSPPLSLAVMRRYGPEKVASSLHDLGFQNRTPADVTTYLDRSDLGRHLARERRSLGETRGNPAEDSRQVFEAFADYVGFSAGKDKALNVAFGAALETSSSIRNLEEVKVHAERAVSFLPSLIPDLLVETPAEARAFEFTYRKGDFLHSKNRSTVAQYCLGKLKGYATSLGWITPGA